MKTQSNPINVIVAGILLLALTTTLAWAQGPASDTFPSVAPSEVAASPLGTAITYQGQLKQGGSPVTGTCDLRFILYDAAVGGAQVGPIQEKAGVAISNGLFTVPDLDFGAAAFAGQARWLDVAVRCPAGSGSYTGLTPRQALTAAPYALYAAQVGAHNHLGQTWTGTDNPLVINGAFNAGSNNASLLLSNSTGNGLRVASAGGAGVRVSSAGGDGIYVDSAGQTGFGVARAAEMGVYVDSVGGRGLVVGTAGSDGVYVGKAGTTSTSAPSGRNHGVEVAGAQGSGLYVGHADQDGIEIGAAGQSGVSVNQAAAFGLAVNSAGWHGLYVAQAGNDGLRVQSAGQAGVRVNSAGGDGVYVVSAGQTGFGVASATAMGVYVDSAGTRGLAIGKAGDDGVYIGQAGAPSSTSSSGEKNGLEVAGAQGYGVYIGRADKDGVRVSSAGQSGVAATGATHGVYGETSSSTGVGVYGYARATSGGAYGVKGVVDSPSGAGVMGVNLTTGGTGVDGWGKQIGVHGVATSSTSGQGVYGFTAGTDSQAVYGETWGANSAGVRGKATQRDSYGVYAENSDSQGVGLYARGGASGYAAVFDGTTQTKVLEITGGSDLAEPFEIAGAATVTPGAVVAIDPVHPGQLRVADAVYDRTVAGCISGANGINPGLTMTQMNTATEDALPVALSGRVYCWADASFGAIQPGDLLTTSSTPGHAQRVEDYSRAQGAILGKAMSVLEEGRGLVLVLVSLQ